MTRLPKNPVDMKSPSLLKTSQNGRCSERVASNCLDSVYNSCLIWIKAFGNCLILSQAQSILLPLRQSTQLKHQAAIKTLRLARLQSIAPNPLHLDANPSSISSLAEPRMQAAARTGSTIRLGQLHHRTRQTGDHNGLLVLPEALDCSQHA
ncbi:hypothetical protein M431DRAFT_430172 [Trichoderma harzianum CBS 226.95]|uniref:Uncharacterized protein n=1 Tax=Trichoderma harzianum CBS 226.95 TaxID=983964 RepID=A0A2T4ACQ2_TRIHA|nr:hypothetical protein M431DRAFT_430172 [Trichoderma harzianum CBS 226.95]PTB54826.1 hypothetical protein M431DRAFT_430172 [Trichoderma harzianum CBS 226.95]